MYKIDPEQLATTDIKKILQYLLEKHSTYGIEKLQDYYEGKHDILSRTMIDDTNPNNKIVTNLCKYITDVTHGYFMGAPVVYSERSGVAKPGIITKVKKAIGIATTESYMETLQDIFDANNERDHNAEMSKSQSIKGCVYELLYMDEQPAVRFARLEREKVIYVESADIESEPVLAVRIYEVDPIIAEIKKFYDVYTDTEIITFEMVSKDQAQSLVDRSRVPHYFGEIPIIAYPNNEEMIGDFEGIISLNDEYNQAQSDTANDLEYFTNAYLKMTGVTLDHPSVQKLKESRIITLPDKECAAEYLIKDVNDTVTENYKKRIRDDIHAASQVPDLSSERFSSNLSGVAIAYKVWGMDQITAMKERKFHKSLQRRIKLITNILNTKGKNWDWRDIDIIFTRNMPQNLNELSQVVNNLRSMVSDETLLAMLPFIDDPALELERVAEQNQGKVDLYEFDDEGDTDEPVEES